MKVFNTYYECKDEILFELGSGNLVILYTDTAYALSADATSEKALKKLIEYKGKREGKPISIGVDSLDMAEEYVDINREAKKMFLKYLPGKLTIVLNERKNSTLSEFISPNKTVGIRIPSDDDFIDLVKSFGRPITTTSANISNNPTIFSLDDFVKSTPIEKQEYISIFLDKGFLYSEVSTVVDMTKDSPIILRQGAVYLD